MVDSITKKYRKDQLAGVPDKNEYSATLKMYGMVNWISISDEELAKIKAILLGKDS